MSTFTDALLLLVGIAMVGVGFLMVSHGYFPLNIPLNLFGGLFAGYGGWNLFTKWRRGQL